jgi:hypothetical protein
MRFEDGRRQTADGERGLETRGYQPSSQPTIYGEISNL